MVKRHQYLLIRRTDVFKGKYEIENRNKIWNVQYHRTYLSRAYKNTFIELPHTMMTITGKHLILLLRGIIYVWLRMSYNFEKLYSILF